MKRILLSGALILAVAAVVVGATGAFFSDSETSTANLFTAGAIDLRVASQCHYWQDNGGGYVDVGCGAGASFGNWALTDLLSGVHKYFNFNDVKPGDRGENTVSLEVTNNDAWGQLQFNISSDSDVTCTEPELDPSADPTCTNVGPGELRQNTNFFVWLDQGAVPGFQNTSTTVTDVTEGDNVYQAGNEPSLWSSNPLPFGTQNVGLASTLAAAYTSAGCTDPDGNTGGAACHGLAADGRVVASAYYSFGVAWEIPNTVGNAVQTDSFGGDVTLNVTQHRNQVNPY